MKRWARVVVPVMIVLSTGLAATGARAAEPPLPSSLRAETLASVRALVTEGDALWDKGRYGDSLDRFVRASQLLDSPPIGVRRAECLERLGRLVEASEAYAHVARMTPSARAPAAYTRAVELARTRMAPLLLRLAKLTIDAEAGTQAITLDGKALPRALWGVAVPVDPGEHIIVRDNERVVVTLREGQAVRTSLPPRTMTAPSGSAPFARAASPSVSPSSSTPIPVASDSPQRTWGWVTLSVGAAGLLSFAILGGLSVGKYGDLDRACLDGTCPTKLRDDVATYNALRTATTVSLIAGAALVGTGLTLILTSRPREGSDRAVTVRPHVGVGSLSLSGEF